MKWNSTRVRFWIDFQLDLSKESRFNNRTEHWNLSEFNSCSFPAVPQGFYDKSWRGEASYWRRLPILASAEKASRLVMRVTSLETDLVKLATGFNGERKLRDIFLSKVFQDSFLGSSKAAVPLYRLVVSFPFLIKTLKCMK